MKPTLISLAALAAVLGTTTWWALESGDVAVIETQTPAGTVRSTHVWYAEPDGELWLEAGTPENAWFQDALQSPAITFKASGRVSRHTAEPIDSSSGHSRIRSLIRAKYGFRDRWVGFIFDTSRSVAVRLVPVEGTHDAGQRN